MWNPDLVQSEPISPDGSQRCFLRLLGPENHSVLVITPPEKDGAGMREARAAWEIGRHLYGKGISVPKPYGFDADSGRLFVEDLGDQRLYDLLLDLDVSQQLYWYRQVVVELVRMQVMGGRGFLAEWCWETPYYDRSLMLERESGYFLQALCRDFLGISFASEPIDEECHLLAERAGEAPVSFFLHRDFQSRNIMIESGRVRFIDFQGGRFGPLAYDLASLLLDPYIGLSEGMQEELKKFYLVTLQGYVDYDATRFEREYFVLALQRNLQILGAFAFLSRKRKKPFFARFLPPALASLNSLLAKPEAADYVGLKNLGLRCAAGLNQVL